MKDQKKKDPRSYYATQAVATLVSIVMKLVAQSLEQRLIKSGGRGFDSRPRFFPCLVWSPISLLGLTLGGEFMDLLSITTYVAELIPRSFVNLLLAFTCIKQSQNLMKRIS